MSNHPRRKAQAFEIAQVRLLEGPFRDAMLRNAEYLLQLEPDRLLARFRESAGLAPKAKVYGGWESKALSGHTLGHYLSACAMTYAADGDPRFLERVTYVVDELAACQEAGGAGFVGAVPEGRERFARIAAGDIDVGNFGLNGMQVPWYNLHKTFAGLLDAWRHAGSEKALHVFRGLCDWTAGLLKDLDDAQVQRMLECEHGGMNDVLAEAAERLGDPRLLDLSLRFNHHKALDPLARREDVLDGMHANTQIPKAIGAARQYEATGREDLRAAAEFFWRTVVHERSYVNGGHSEGEHFREKGRMHEQLTPMAAETCNTYNMLKLTRRLFAWRPAAEFGDYAERALLNHILASQEPRRAMMLYFANMQSGCCHTYSSPFDSFWCCTGTGIENHARTGESIYWRDEAGALLVNLFIASELDWAEHGLLVRQETRFPEEDRTRLVFHAADPVPLAVRLRRPGWLAGPLEVSVNGLPTAATLDVARGWATVERTWRDGDVLEARLPMGLALEAVHGAPHKVAVLHGPVVLAGDLGDEGLEGDVTTAGAERRLAELPRPEAPVLVTGRRPPEHWLRPVPGRPLEFQTDGVGRPRDVRLEPLTRSHHKWFAVYWDTFTAEEWAERAAAWEAERARERALEGRTLDALVPEMQPERDHDFQGEASAVAPAHGRMRREAAPGGWFSYAMAVDPDAPVALAVDYWGGDGAPLSLEGLVNWATGSDRREFDILVDGEPLAHEKLLGESPDGFVTKTYPVPPALTQGKQSVVVTFRAGNKAVAGGVYGCRILREET